MFSNLMLYTVGKLGLYLLEMALLRHFGRLVVFEIFDEINKNLNILDG